MERQKYIGTSVPRKDGVDKVCGRLRYLGDKISPHMLHAAIKTSPHAHALIHRIDSGKALTAPGVRAVLTGADVPGNIGIYLGDKPPLAEGAPLLHEEMADYSHIPAILPEPGSNIANRTKIRKGDIETGFRISEVVIEESFSFPPGDHVAMETRASTAEILDDGQVIVRSTTQAPFVVRSLLSAAFKIPVGKITVISDPLGGGFGGKAGIQLEGLAFLLSKAVGGRLIRLVNSREKGAFNAAIAPQVS